MSMPSFPKDGANMTREQALTMIIASIAMEENALSRVMDAEGDKLRYILDRCRETCGGYGTPEELLEVNQSVTRLLEAAARNQAALRCKLALALEAEDGCPPKPPCPPTPPCDPCGSFMQLGLLPDCGFQWKDERLLPWESLGGRGSAIRWSREAPSLVKLDPGKAYSVGCTFNVRDFPAASGSICLEGTDAPPLHFFIRCGGGEAVTLQYSTLLLPGRRPPSGRRPASGSDSAVSFRLRSKIGLCVEEARLNIVEL